jgi:hypothetical protein
MENKNVYRLIQDGHGYKEAENRWLTRVEKIKAYCSEQRLIGGELFTLVEPTSTESHSIAIQFTDIKLVCQFRHMGGGSVLLFGYMKPEIGGQDKFKVTNKVYLDNLGNALEAKGGQPGPYCIQHDDFIDNVFFAECRKVQDAVWDKL